MAIRLLFVSFLCFNSLGFCQVQQLSSSAKVSVLTFGPGNTLQDAFGHNAFRIKDNTLGIDAVYGYGQYDFDAPNFYLKFASGKLNYKISKYQFADIYRYYATNKRNVKEQVLNFSAEEKQKLYNILTINYLPQNRNYVYDFFYDNCATRIRDVSQKATNNAIDFTYPEPIEWQTFRALLLKHLHWNTWGSFGIDIALGSVVDKKATVYEYQFLPKYIHYFFDTATVSNNKPLVSHSSTLLHFEKPTTPLIYFFWSPLFWFIIISSFIIYKTYLDYKTKRRTKWLDGLLFALTGIVGLILALLWFATDHTATVFNYNLLWAFPFNLFVVFPLLQTKPKSWVVGFIKFLILAFCLMLLHSITGVQSFSWLLLPFAFALLLRYLFLVRAL